jgi:hypothetical protein
MQDAAYLAEMMMRRKYRKIKNIELAESFWNLPAYKKEFQLQVIQGKKLLAAYSFELLVELFEENAWIYSLFLKKIYDLAEQKKEKQRVTVSTIKKDDQVTFRKQG